MDLKRLSFGSIGLNALPNGKTRYLSRKEYGDFRGYIKFLDKEQNKAAQRAKDLEANQEASEEGEDFSGLFDT